MQTMRKRTGRRIGQAAAMVAATLTVSGCQLASRLSEVGDVPQLSPITNPQAMPDYRPINMPMPAPQPVEDNPNSLWRPGARAFFKDIRAKEVGDQLTVRMNFDDSATWANQTTRNRTEDMGMSVDSMFGYEGKLRKIFPNQVDNANLVALGSKDKTDGTGNIKRKEKLELTFAAMVTQVLPNGSLVVRGHQEVRVNGELRELILTGIIRPQDIDADNTISHDRVAEMRMAYGGRGTLSDLQQARWGSQLLDIILPF